MEGSTNEQEGTPQIGQESEDCGAERRARSLGYVRDISEKFWDDAIGSGGSNGERRFSGRRTQSEASLGKILDHLKQLREQYLAYVDAHGERLQARLQENRQHKLQAIETMAQLESDIVELLKKADADS